MPPARRTRRVHRTRRVRRLSRARRLSASARTLRGVSSRSSPPAVRPPERIAIGELTLERWRHRDAEQLTRAAAASREHLRRWMAWASHSDLATHRRFLADSDEGWRRGARFEYAIRDRDAQLLGGVGLMERIGPGGLELGYWVHAEHTRRGVASRAAAALTEAALALRAITHVEVHHDEANVASGAVPARLGFRKLGVWPVLAQAPADSGREVRWRIDARDFPASEASALLERSRAVVYPGTGGIVRRYDEDFRP